MATYRTIGMLDEIAWLYNLRGNEYSRLVCYFNVPANQKDSIPYNPVFFSYAVVTPTTAMIYVNKDKLSAEVTSYLGYWVDIRPYDAIFDDMKALSATLADENSAAKANA